MSYKALILRIFLTDIEKKGSPKTTRKSKQPRESLVCTSYRWKIISRSLGMVITEYEDHLIKCHRMLIHCNMKLSVYICTQWKLCVYHSNPSKTMLHIALWRYEEKIGDEVSSLKTNSNLFLWRFFPYERLWFDNSQGYLPNNSDIMLKGKNYSLVRLCKSKQCSDFTRHFIPFCSFCVS